MKQPQPKPIVIGIYKRVFQCNSSRLWQTLYKTYIRPHLEFGIQAWSPRKRYRDSRESSKASYQAYPRTIQPRVRRTFKNFKVDKSKRATLERRRDISIPTSTQQHRHRPWLEVAHKWLLPTCDAPRMEIPPLVRNCQQRENFFT